MKHRVRWFLFFLAIFLAALLVVPVQGQQEGGDVAEQSADSAEEDETEVPEEINVHSATSDQDIQRRLYNILEATGWFTAISVQVDEGVVFLDGQADSDEHRLWAGRLAGKIADVTAVVNRLKMAERSLWDVSPAFSEMDKIWQAFMQVLPRFAVGFVVFLLIVLLSRLVVISLRRFLDRRMKPLLRDVTVRIITILALLVGFYLILKIAGLSGLAATVLGGTGIAGLVAGIAFRDILENYLASILISLRNPFRVGDLVAIEEHTGFVEKVTTRGTVLINLDGNHVQIPNAIVYKSIIRNFTANPNRRESFEVGIGFDNEVAHAQRVALQVIDTHPAVLKDPESLVLVDRLGSATVVLKIQFWYDGSSYDRFRLRSSLIRLVKKAFEEENISMPDEAREILFPEGVPVLMEKKEGYEPQRPAAVVEKGADEAKTRAEGDLASGDKKMREQARSFRMPEEGSSLLPEE